MSKTGGHSHGNDSVMQSAYAAQAIEEHIPAARLPRAAFFSPREICKELVSESLLRAESVARRLNAKRLVVCCSAHAALAFNARALPWYLSPIPRSEP